MEKKRTKKLKNPEKRVKCNSKKNQQKQGKIEKNGQKKKTKNLIRRALEGLI